MSCGGSVWVEVLRDSRTGVIASRLNLRRVKEGGLKGGTRDV